MHNSISAKKAELSEYSDANIKFHQMILELSGSELLRSTADGLLMHMHAVRRRAMGESDRASRSVADHMEIIEALESRDAELASRLVREHTMRLHDHIEDRWTRLNNLDESKQRVIEAAAEKKTKMFNKEEGSIIYTYQVLTGNNAGVYERYLVGQSSSSYDLDRSEELEYWSENVMPYAEAVGGQMRWQWEEWATVGDQPEPPKYINKTVFRFKPDMEAHVARYIYRWGKVWEKRNPDAFRRVFSPVSGGDLNVFVSFSGFEEY